MEDRIDILGYRVSRVSGLRQAIAIMEQLIASGDFHYMVVGNLYCVMMSRRDSEFLEIANSSALTVADGISLVWATRILGEPLDEKVNGPLLFEAFSEVAAQREYSFFLVGGGPGGSEQVAEALTAKYPGLKILGTYSPQLGPIHDDVNDEIVGLVNDASPDVLWVGLGAPRQEKWIWRNRTRLNTRIAIGVGAAFDYQMGRQEYAPEWVQRYAVEWLYRPTQDLSVLWRKRYDLWIPQFVLPLFWQAIQKRVLKRPNR